MERLNERIRSLESQCKSKDILLKSLESELEVEKSYKKTIQSEMASKEAEITMQKVTITHLQDAIVSIKRGHTPQTSPSSAAGLVYHI